MIQRRSRLCFLHEAPHPLLIRCNFARQNLQSDFAIKFRVLDQIHLTHSARADLRADFIAAELCASANRQPCSLPIKSLRQSHAAHEILEAWVSTQAVKDGFHLHQDKVRVPLLIRFLQPDKSLSIFTQAHIDERYEIG
jgi:hypothetical protein